MVSAIERYSLLLSANKRGFYEKVTMIPSALKNSVRYREVSIKEHVRFKEVQLYLLMFFTLIEEN